MPAPRQSNIPAPTLSFIVLATMIGLYGVDKFLAAQEQSELALEARNHYFQGRKQLQAGKPHEAVVDLARAHAIERSNREYQLTLATAQLSDRQPSSARDTLNDLLAADSNDGRANLLMARVLASESRFKDADSYYHRAIYGAWTANSLAESQRVRLELAKMLAEHGNSQELLSELLLLQSASSQDSATRKQIAQLLLQAGSAPRAVEAYRDMIHENSDDVEAYLGLGSAEILAGNYRAAENAVMAALHRQPYDAKIQSQLRLVVKLASLDPTSRRLSTAEKYRRSVAILQLAQQDLSACLKNPAPANPEKIQGAATNEIAEARLDQAESLWKQRTETCKASPAADDPLPLLMKKLSQ